MCIVKPLKVIRIEGKKAVLENGLEALFDSSTEEIKPGDRVIVYGNYIIRKYD